MTLISNIKTILEASGIEASIYLATTPKDDNSLSIYSTGGYERTVDVEHPTFQLYVQHDSYEVAYQTLERCKDILHAQAKVTVGNRTFLSFHQTSDIIDLRRDENGRMHMSINFRTYVERKKQL